MTVQIFIETQMYYISCRHLGNLRKKAIGNSGGDITMNDRNNYFPYHYDINYSLILINPHSDGSTFSMFSDFNNSNYILKIYQVKSIKW